MTIALKIVVPGKSLGKGRPRFSRATGRAFTPEATARRENLIALAASEAMAGRRLLDEALAVRVEVFVSVPQGWSQKKRGMALLGALRPETAPDLDNIMKTLDALNGVAWVDDKHVVELAGAKYYSEQPRLEITISTIFNLGRG